MSDIRIPNHVLSVAPVSQTLPKHVNIEKAVDLPDNSPSKERRRQQRRRGRAYRRPLIELRTGQDRRRGDHKVDVRA